MQYLGRLAICVTVLALSWSGISPKDRFTWFLEIAPVLILMPVAIYYHRKYKLSPLLIILATLHALVLCLGGKYTYAEVPLGFWVSDLLDLGRNHYDRLGHFMQGFVPAILTREVLLRVNVLHKKGGWLFLIVCAICLAFSACYEFIEWFTAISSGEAADAFLGTQGDVWDTQWDMFLALVGSIMSQLTLGHLHDRQIQKPNTN